MLNTGAPVCLGRPLPGDTVARATRLSGVNTLMSIIDVGCVYTKLVIGRMNELTCSELGPAIHCNICIYLYVGPAGQR